MPLTTSGSAPAVVREAASISPVARFLTYTWSYPFGVLA
jgi:hypothetical protein